MESGREKFMMILPAAVLLTAAGCLGGLPEAGTADAKLYQEKCTACHRWAHPKRHTAQEWDHYLELMESHMQKKNMSLSAGERDAIRNYLHRNAR